jgi:hypothetical protein
MSTINRRIDLIIMTTAGFSWVFASACMLRRQEPFHTWYYVFSWWSYIFFLEAFLHMRGAKSDLFDSPRRFLLQAPLSVTIWLIFEVFNFRLENWHYVHVPSSLPMRWFGYVISFATVLPGLNATKHLFHYLGCFNRLRWSPLNLPNAVHLWIIGAGGLSLILPILWPRFFFPLVWLAFIMLLAPFHLSASSPGLVQDLQTGRPRELLEWLVSGLLCGFLWEFWNFWAGAKWVYTVPYLGWLKVFEMPLLGFLGFPPFAVECYLLTDGVFRLSDWLDGRRSCPAPPRPFCFAGWFVLIIIWFLVFTGIDRNTVLSYGV